MWGEGGGAVTKIDRDSIPHAHHHPNARTHFLGTTPTQFKDSVSSKVQETFSLQLEEPEPAKPTPPPSGGGGKKKKAKTEGAKE